jgi:6-phosphogluconolactonase
MPYRKRQAARTASALSTLLFLFSGNLALNAQNQLSFPQPQFVIVANGASDNVSVFAIDDGTGALTQVPGSPFPGGAEPVAVAIDPKGKFAYVVNQSYPSSQGNVSTYAINPVSGVLTQMETSPFADTYGEPYGVAINPKGQFLYTPNVFSDDVSIYAINANGGLAPVSGYFWTSAQPEGMAIDPTGKFAYVSNSLSDDVSAYTINPTSGELTQVEGSPYGTGGATPGSVEPITFDPAGRFVFVSNINSDDIAAFTINPNSGALSPVEGSPFQQAVFNGGGFGVTVDPAGRFLYMANGVAGSISVFAINQISGALTPIAGSPFPAGSYVVCVAIDQTGRFAYASNISGNNISAFRVAGNGALAPVVGSPFPAGGNPFGIAITPARGSASHR